MTAQNGANFTTIDSDNDLSTNNCAIRFRGGWWYKRCHRSNLNGVYGSKAYSEGINYRPLTTYYESMKSTRMLVAV